MSGVYSRKYGTMSPLLILNLTGIGQNYGDKVSHCSSLTELDKCNCLEEECTRLTWNKELSSEGMLLKMATLPL